LNGLYRGGTERVTSITLLPEKNDMTCIKLSTKNLIQGEDVLCYPNLTEIQIKGDSKIKIIEKNFVIEFIPPKTCELTGTTLLCDTF
jgi:hypothetical protein